VDEIEEIHIGTLIQEIMDKNGIKESWCKKLGAFYACQFHFFLITPEFDAKTVHS